MSVILNEKEYVESVRANLRVQLDNISIERSDGSIEKLSDKRKTEIHE